MKHKTDNEFIPHWSWTKVSTALPNRSTQKYPNSKLPFLITTDYSTGQTEPIESRKEWIPLALSPSHSPTQEMSVSNHAAVSSIANNDHHHSFNPNIFPQMKTERYRPSTSNTRSNYSSIKKASPVSPITQRSAYSAHSDFASSLSSLPSQNHHPHASLPPNQKSKGDEKGKHIYTTKDKKVKFTLFNNKNNKVLKRMKRPRTAPIQYRHAINSRNSMVKIDKDTDRRVAMSTIATRQERHIKMSEKENMRMQRRAEIYAINRILRTKIQSDLAKFLDQSARTSRRF